MSKLETAPHLRARRIVAIRLTTERRFDCKPGTIHTIALFGRMAPSVKFPIARASLPATLLRKPLRATWRRGSNRDWRGIVAVERKCDPSFAHSLPLLMQKGAGHHIW